MRLAVKCPDVMRETAIVLSLVALTACGDYSQGPVAPWSPPSSPPPGARSDVPQVIVVGDEVHATLEGFNNTGYHFALTAPSDGRLLVRASWARRDGWLYLVVNETKFYPDERLFDLPDSDSFVEGSVDVTAGRTYRITLWDIHAPWDYDGVKTPFTLTTSMP
jgi:hypothetical protein